jgi:hypothetical protein
VQRKHSSSAFPSRRRRNKLSSWHLDNHSQNLPDILPVCRSQEMRLSALLDWNCKLFAFMMISHIFLSATIATWKYRKHYVDMIDSESTM